VILIRDIQAVVAAHHRVPVEAMRSPDAIGMRVRDNAWPRQDAMYLASCLTTHGYVNIGRMFGGRDHSTVINGIRSAAKRLRNDGAAQDAMRIMVRKLLSVSA
jgi:chromosomal replication initiator protein